MSRDLLTTAPGPGDLDPGPPMCLCPGSCPHDHLGPCATCDGTGWINGARCPAGCPDEDQEDDVSDAETSLVPVPLDGLSTERVTLADHARAVALAQTVGKVIDGHAKALKVGLHAEADRIAEQAGGGGLTQRVAGVGQVILTAPEPKAHVSDTQAFGEWLAKKVDPDESLGLVTWRRLVEVTDHSRLASTYLGILTSGPTDGSDQRTTQDCLGLEQLLIETLDVTTEYLPSETALDTLLDKRWAAVTSDDGEWWELAEFDPETGVLGRAVPGVTVTCAAPTAYVKVDKHAKEWGASQVRDALGLRDALGGGQ